MLLLAAREDCSTVFDRVRLPRNLILSGVAWDFLYGILSASNNYQNNLVFQPNR